MSISNYLVAPLLAWLLAQMLKYFLVGLKTGKFNDISYLYKSGSMPSAHSAVMVALLVVIGAQDGANSGLFGAVAVITGVVMYDAVNVRRAVGEQGTVILKLLASLKGAKAPFAAQGHRLTDVMAGIAIGIISGGVVLQFL